MNYSKICVKRPLSKIPKIGCQYQLSLNAGQKYCRMLSILQYFRPSLSYQLLLRYLFCLFLSGRFTHDLLYVYFDNCLNMLFGAQKKLLPDTVFRYAPKIYVGENSFFWVIYFCLHLPIIRPNDPLFPNTSNLRDSTVVVHL